MLTEEAHHLFVGETGVGRVVERTAQLMKDAPEGDVTKMGGIPLDIIQRYINEWYSASLDLFGGEDSSNAATYFAAGLKGRFNESESKKWPDHVALEGAYAIDVPTPGGLKREEIPLRRAMNLVLRDSYVEDCERALARWNKSLEEAGHTERLRLPSQRFNRLVGIYANMPFDPEGSFCENPSAYLPTAADYAYVKSLMKPVYEPGAFASWIAPPRRGINGQPIDFEYVKFVR